MNLKKKNSVYLLMNEKNREIVYDFLRKETETNNIEFLSNGLLFSNDFHEENEKQVHACNEYGVIAYHEGQIPGEVNCKIAGVEAILVSQDMIVKHNHLLVSISQTYPGLWMGLIDDDLKIKTLCCKNKD